MIINSTASCTYRFFFMWLMDFNSALFHRFWTKYINWVDEFSFFGYFRLGFAHRGDGYHVVFIVAGQYVPFFGFSFHSLRVRRGWTAREEIRSYVLWKYGIGFMGRSGTNDGHYTISNRTTVGVVVFLETTVTVVEYLLSTWSVGAKTATGADYKIVIQNERPGTSPVRRTIAKHTTVVPVRNAAHGRKQQRRLQWPHIARQLYAVNNLEMRGKSQRTFPEQPGQKFGSTRL